jgi:hypothetical protein
MSIEARTAFDRLLTEGEAQPAAATLIPEESDEARVIRQNREAAAAWSGFGSPVKA